MVAFTFLSFAVTAISGVLAVPAASPDPSLPDFEIGPHTGNLARRQGGMDYNQNWKAGQGNINYQAQSNGYSVTFSNAGDFVVGKGWKTGKARNISFSGSTQQQSGTVLVSVYGWTKNPLIEYYVQEYTSNGAGSAQGQKVGTLVSDGSTYEIWKHQQVNQPSISGTATFWQFISNRVSKRPGSGTVTMQNHFDAWKKAGLQLGSQMDYQVLATEGWGNAGGNSKYTLSEVSGGGGNQQSSQSPQPQPSSTSKPPVQQPSSGTKTETKSVTATATLTKTETKTQATTSTVVSTVVSTVTKTEATTIEKTATKTETMLVSSICAVVPSPSVPSIVAPSSPAAVPSATAP
jgi:endo-1,4-beta-xylanase